ncbi:MAG: crossover junction endodeoxyribonuclease RuvC, partial [Candidatus Babeliales bacterium]
MEQAQVILGVDPGFHVTGFALLKKEGGKVYLLDCGYLKMSAERSLVERTGQFHIFMLDKITQAGVTEIALETSFLGKNPQTFLKLGYLRGILYLLAHQHSLSIYEFAPREVKAAVTGSGGASKDQVASMVIRLFPKITQIHSLARNDVTDALAVGICGIWRQSSRLQQL